MKALRARVYSTPFARLFMVLLFASLCTGIQHAELLDPAMRVEEGIPAPITLRLPPAYFRLTLLRNEFHYLPASRAGCPDMVPIGRIVPPGSECAGMVAAFENHRRPLQYSRLAGSFVLFMLIGFLLTGYMSRDGMGRSRWVRSQLALLTMLLTLTAVCKSILLFTPLPFEVLPVASVPLLASIILGRRLSFGVGLATALIMSALLNFDVRALFIFMVGGFFSITASDAYKKRISTILKSSVLVSVVTLVAVVLTTLLFAGTLDIYEDLMEHVSPISSIWLAGIYGGLSAGVLAMLLLPVFGLMVGEVSRGRLFDLLELDHPLLKRLRERAPSTWEHSRAMANLGEAAAFAIGVNATLVRVGAYFHDVGKSVRPDYYIENQGGANPHDQLPPYESARMIFSHVVEGARLLRREGVPEDVVEFTYSHHGTSTLEYFWQKNLASGNPEHLSQEDFRYPGHRPTTRETAILMIVDAMEAAARTVSEPDRNQFETLLQRILFDKMAQGQFDESGLTMLDLRIVFNTIIGALVSMHHSRIKYPWQDKLENPDPALSEDASNEPVQQNDAEQPTETAEPVASAPPEDPLLPKSEPEPVSIPAEANVQPSVLPETTTGSQTDSIGPPLAKPLSRTDTVVPASPSTGTREGTGGIPIAKLREKAEVNEPRNTPTEPRERTGSVTVAPVRNAVPIAPDSARSAKRETDSAESAQAVTEDPDVS